MYSSTPPRCALISYIQIRKIYEFKNQINKFTPSGRRKTMDFIWEALKSLYKTTILKLNNVELEQTAIAQSVLTYYNLQNAQLTYLGQSENTTFRVETATGDKFVLRLHFGIEDNGNVEHNIWREPSVIQSELLWLNAIARDTQLIVPQPIQNCLGEWVTNFARTELKSSISCSLLQWIEGEHLHGKPTAQQVCQLGKLMAQMHSSSSCWSLPPNFSRPKHDAEQLKSATSKLSVLVKNGTISTKDYLLFQKAAARVQELMLTLPITNDTWGLIHADLNKRNYVLYGEQVRPIDFSRCGFGFYLYDIGQCVSDIDASLRLYFFEGYTSIRELPADYQNIVEAFIVGAIVQYFAFLSAKPQHCKWLYFAVPYVVKNHLHSYLNGNTFMFLK